MAKKLVKAWTQGQLSVGMDYFVWKFVSHFKLGSVGLSSFPRKEFKIRYVDFWTNINITQRKLLYTLSKTDQLWLSNVKNNLSLSDLVIDFFLKNQLFQNDAQQKALCLFTNTKISFKYVDFGQKSS